MMSRNPPSSRIRYPHLKSIATTKSAKVELKTSSCQTNGSWWLNTTMAFPKVAEIISTGARRSRTGRTVSTCGSQLELIVVLFLVIH